MSDVSAKLVKELRDRTNAGIMDCKKALVATNSNIDEAVKWLKEKGMSDAAKKSSRTTSEGTVAVAVSDDKRTATIVEVKCETDFVARNADYKTAAGEFAKQFINETNPTTDSVVAKYGDKIKEMISKFGENITVGEVGKLSVETGMVQQYIHGAGNIGVIAAFKTGKQDSIAKEDFVSMSMGVVMHIAAMNPEFLNRDEVSSAALEEQKQVLMVQAKESGKPDNVIEKMVMGQLSKFYAEVCLLEQPFVKDQKRKVSDIIADAAKKIGDEITLVKYIRFQLGE